MNNYIEEKIKEFEKELLYTGFCDENGEKIYYGDWIEVQEFGGAVWQAKVVHEDGYATVSIVDVKNIKNPKDWKQKHDYIRSRYWSVDVGYGEMGSWNEARKTLSQICGYFKSSDELFKVRDKFNKKYGEYHSNENLYRELPCRIVKKGEEKYKLPITNKQISKFLKQALQDCQNREREIRMLELADAQLLGFAHGVRGFSIEELVDSMGLTKKEWEELNKKFGLVYLTDEMREDISNKIKELK